MNKLFGKAANVYGNGIAIKGNQRQIKMYKQTMV